MKYMCGNEEVTLEDVQLGLRDLEESLGEICMMCEEAGEEYNPDGKGLAGLVRLLQCVAHVQRVNVDFLISKHYQGKVKMA